MRIGNAAVVALVAATLPFGAASCVDLETEYRISDERLRRDIGPKSVTYERVEELADLEWADKQLPTAGDAEKTAARALRRQDLLDVDREEVDLALGSAIRRRKAYLQIGRRLERAQRLLDRRPLTVEVYPNEDYELADGESFARAWNELVKTERRFLDLWARLIDRAATRERLAIAALHAGIDEFAQGGGDRFVSAARRWYAVEAEGERRNYEARFDRAIAQWNKADEHLTEVQDEAFADYVGDGYPRSYLVVGRPSSAADEEEIQRRSRNLRRRINTRDVRRSRSPAMRRRK